MAWSDRQKAHRLRKQFRTLVNNVIANVWDGEWDDTSTGRPMKGFGVELWTMRDGKIAIWECAFNTGPSDLAGDLQTMLGQE